jgi:5-methylcytosine-specific restriction endonuclease McrA
MKRRRHYRAKPPTPPLTPEERVRRHEHNVRVRASGADKKIEELQKNISMLLFALESFARSRGVELSALSVLREAISAKYWRRQQIQEELKAATARGHRAKDDLGRLEAEDRKKQNPLSILFCGYQPSPSAMEKIEQCRQQLRDAAAVFESKRTELMGLQDTKEEKEFASVFDRVQGFEKQIREYESAVCQMQRLDEKEQRARDAEIKRKEKEAMNAAIVAAFFNKTRDLAEDVKKELSGQFAICPNCPYCGSPYGDEPHADHIYAVSKGGMSVFVNMVIICSTCNLRKGPKTLREFIVACGLDRVMIEATLERLGKVF